MTPTRVSRGLAGHFNGANETPPPWGGEAGFRRPSKFFVWREETSEVMVEGLNDTTRVHFAGSGCTIVRVSFADHPQAVFIGVALARCVAVYAVA